MTCGSAGAHLSKEARFRDHETRDSTRAHLINEVRFRADGHMAAPELTSTKRRGTGPRDMWWHRSSPLERDVVRSYSLHDSVYIYILFLILI
jgi:hypothetical protein